MLLSGKRGYEKNAVNGAISLSLSVIIVKLLGVLYKIPLANLLGDEGMGYFNSAYTVFSFFYIFCTAGVPKSIMLLISERLAKRDDFGISEILKVGFCAFGIIGIALSLLLSFLSSPLSLMIGNPKTMATLVFVAPSIIFVSLTGVLRGYLSAKMRLFDIAISQIIEGVLRLAFGLIFAIIAIKSGMESSWVSALTIAGATLGAFGGLLYLYIIFKREYGAGEITSPLLVLKQRTILTKIFRISFPITVSAALMSLSGVIDLFLIINRLEGIGYTTAEATALYGNYTTLAVSMFNLAVAILTPISLSFLPSIARSRAEEDFRSFRFGIRSSLELSAILSAPICIGFIVYSKEILAFLFGETMASVGAPLLVILSPAVIFMSLILTLNSSLEAAGRPSLAMLSMIIGALVKVVFSGILIGNPNFGISGAPLGSVISFAVSALVSLIFLSFITNHAVPIISTSILPYLTSSIAILFSKRVYDDPFSELSPSINLILAILLSALIYIALLLFCGAISRKNIHKMAKFTKLS